MGKRSYWDQEVLGQDHEQGWRTVSWDYGAFLKKPMTEIAWIVNGHASVFLQSFDIVSLQTSYFIHLVLTAQYVSFFHISVSLWKLGVSHICILLPTVLHCNF